MQAAHPLPGDFRRLGIGGRNSHQRRSGEDRESGRDRVTGCRRRVRVEVPAFHFRRSLGPSAAGRARVNDSLFAKADRPTEWARRSHMHGQCRPRGRLLRERQSHKTINELDISF